jgi:hypothetical protein
LYVWSSRDRVEIFVCRLTWLFACFCTYMLLCADNACSALCSARSLSSTCGKSTTRVPKARTRSSLSRPCFRTSTSPTFFASRRVLEWQLLLRLPSSYAIIFLLHARFSSFTVNLLYTTSMTQSLHFRAEDVVGFYTKSNVANIINHNKIVKKVRIYLCLISKHLVKLEMFCLTL